MVESTTNIDGPASLFCKLCCQNGPSHLYNLISVSEATTEYNNKNMIIPPACEMGKGLSSAQDSWAIVQQEGPTYHSTLVKDLKNTGQKHIILKGIMAITIILRSF